MEKQEKGFPYGHVIGFLVAVALTIFALLVVFKTSFATSTKFTLIGLMAVFQAALQLFMFMHMTEGNDRDSKVIHTIYAIGMGIVIIVGSIWVMTAGHSIH
ncbi:cytochrome aa3 quinol oxidase subunit IV [Fervidibacillus halotolerans]|uniref:Quinol oxidase subunit 4 n=1 Tax=Fervidibacillus halotolerans TaxID=2980027 RepID=A0A9E8LZ64_9BACI|nr:cytochrome aa3 quinol oxidase subunit IV [Fervidibacillus halotolerans]WAA12488.1 cytochrome aa3 quinol oxidase subunit IV [Fervidibacillus halotolerans]